MAKEKKGKYYIKDYELENLFFVQQLPQGVVEGDVLEAANRPGRRYSG